MLRMNRFHVWVLSLAGMLAGTTCRGGHIVKIDTATVKHLDVARFMGKWYEIARYEHRFERGMTHVTAEYTLLPDGKIRVLNRGLKDGKQKEITGKARQPDPVAFPGRLEVSFFLWFYSDYYIFELGPDYQYAVIGSSSDKYLWILARQKNISSPIKEKILVGLKKRGYDISRLVYVKQ